MQDETKGTPEELRAAIAALEARLRERFGDGHPLLAADAYRGSLWWQAACWALDDAPADANEPRELS